MKKKTVAIIGAGLIGRSWSLVFSRAGWNVRLYDQSAEVAEKAIDWIGAALSDLGCSEPDKKAILSRVSMSVSLEEALEDAIYVQENTSEILEVKKKIFFELDRLAAPNVPICSSSSALVASSFSKGLSGETRALVVHPVNPPHLVPLVEIVPSSATAPEIINQAFLIMTEVGQKPIKVRKEVPGFVLNRLQAALVNEAMSLAADGVASIDDIDKCVRHGLGLRWAFIGPFETMDLNADGGIEEYVEKFGDLFEDLGRELGVDRAWDADVRARAVGERRKLLPLAEIQKRQQWRDRHLIGLARYKRQEFTK